MHLYNTAKILLAISIALISSSLNLMAQGDFVSKYKNGNSVKAFSKAEKAQIKNILGDDAGVVFDDENGSFVITEPSKVSQIKSAPGSKSGFTGIKSPGSVADWVAVKKDWWIAKGAGDVLQSRLGKERFNQLKDLLNDKSIGM